MALTAEYIKGNEFQLSTTSQLSVKEAAFKRAGYTFKHWKGEDSDGKKYNELAEDARLTINANSASLSAVWDIINYNITYNNILPAEHSNPSQYTIESDTITFIADPGRIGYTATFNPDKITKGSTGNLTTDVNWNTISYNITYTNLLDGTHSGNPTTYNIETETITFNNPTRNGYTGSFSPTQIVKGTTEDKEITAVWNTVNYDITYTNLLDGTHSGNPTTYNIESNTITFNNPTRTGYTGTFNPATIASGSYGNQEITAVWNTISYNITYTNLLDGTHSGNPTTYNIETETITFNNPTRTGYTGTFNPTQIVKGTYGNQEITAVWNAKTYNITCTDDDPSRGTTTTNIDKVIYGNEFVVTVTPAAEKYSAKQTVITGAKKVEGKDNTYTPDDSSDTILITTSWSDNSGIITYYPGY